MSNKPVIVRLGQGDLKGSACRNAKGVEYFSFQGIPYAHPPLGELRFKAPVPAGPWDQDVLDCRQDPPQCYQRHGIRINEIGGSENCLYLNVYTPEYKFQRRQPVMVWIHGGAFINGSNNIELCGPEYFMNNDVVLVAVNYRVGLLGFLSMEDNSLGVPGNAGLKDQVMALKWIRRNIQEFGGNARNITIFGHGAGAASCHLHMLSPMSKGLFHRVILMSGTALSPWVNGVKGSGQLVAKALDFESTCEKDILEYLQVVRPNELLEAQEIVFPSLVAHKTWLCSPVVENQKTESTFLPDKPINIITSGNYTKVPMIIGFSSLEGMTHDVYNHLLTGKSDTTHDFDTTVPNNLNAKYKNLLFARIADLIEENYLGTDLRIPRPIKTNMKPYYDLWGDVYINRGVFGAVKNHIKDCSARSSVYFYLFDLDTRLNIYKRLTPRLDQKFTGACHGDIVGYLFSTYLTPRFVYGSNEDVAINRMIRMWTNFAKYREPNSPYGFTNTTWTPVTKKDFRLLHISGKLEMKVPPREFYERMWFWDKIYGNDVRTGCL